MIINTYLYSVHVLPGGERRGRRREERREEGREERKEERREEWVLLPPALRVYKSGLAAPVWMIIIIMMC